MPIGPSRPCREQYASIAVALVFGLGACGADFQAEETGTSQQRCQDLAAFVIDRSAISLPTGGGRVVKAAYLQALVDEYSYSVPAHCAVSGVIHPVDKQAPPITFELDMPDHWTRRTLLLGGSGFDGAVPDLKPPLFSAPGQLAQSPLEYGMAVFASDGGHQAGPRMAPIPAVDAAFAMNDEALHNYAGDALKKTRDAAFQIIEAYYGQTPDFNYVAGGSNGGREALVAIQRWPDDFDAAIAAYPFWNAGTTTLMFGTVTQALARPAAYLETVHQALLYDAAIEKCDSLDGAQDGIISLPDECVFDPSTLACDDPAGQKPCLSGAQIEALRVYESGAVFDWLGDGAGHPGYPVFSGADLRGAQQLGSQRPVHPASRNMPIVAHFWYQFARFAVARDADFNPQSLDPTDPGDHTARLRTLTNLLDAEPGGLAAFRARGGKLIIIQGLADPIVSPKATFEFWRGMQDEMSSQDLRAFARLYTIPGFGHGPGGNNAFEPGWDVLSVGTAWRESGQAPHNLIVTDISKSQSGRTRPLCEYPAWPEYLGSGVEDSASSFECILARRP